jgi:hypothetical protein
VENNNLTQFEAMARFQDFAIRLDEISHLQAFMAEPFIEGYYPVPLDLKDPQHVVKIWQGQIVFKASDLDALNITYQAV